MLPPLGVPSKNDLITFFQGLWSLQDVTSSDLFYQFLQLESTEKLFDTYHHIHEADHTKSYFFKLLGLDKPSFSSELLKEIVDRSPSLLDIEKMSIADLQSFNDYCENQYECIQGSLGLIGNLLTDCSHLLDKVQKNLLQLEPIFYKLKIKFERLNYAKQLFPAFGRSPIHLDLVCEQLSKATLNMR